jgi:glc operon protein GlcG
MTIRTVIMKITILFAGLFAFSAICNAQTVQKNVLTLEGAKKAAEAAMAEARKNNEGGVIAVVDDGGNLMYLERLDNTFAAGANISIGKARTAALFKKPTSAFEKIIKDGRTAMVALPDFTPLQGGVPIMMGDVLVGAIGVSGAASAQQDEQVAMAGAKALETAFASRDTDRPSSGGASTDAKPSGVKYFDNKTVSSAFGKGAVLFDDTSNMMFDGGNYMVHASRRDAPGLAEIHELDTDVIYVLDGTSTFITGGTAVDAKPAGPNELRGSSIKDGETRRLAKGDVIIVPNGVPHWFKEVKGPFTYFVVKVRK